MNTKCLILVFYLMAGMMLGAADKAVTNLIVNGSFEDWEWVPLDSDGPVFNQAKKRLKQKENINIDYQGPLFLQLTGYAASMGRMVEGAEAYQGKSLYLVNDWKDDWLVVGFYGPYSQLLESGQEYNWEIWLKGKGVFLFKAWIGGMKTGGEFKWLGFPDLIKVDVTNTWQCYQGQFKVPVMETEGYRQEKKVSAAIVIYKDSAVYIDNFRLWK